MSFCPCGSALTFEECCGLYLSQQACPKTPEALMRSRYTAYSLANMDYIKMTMQGKALVGFNTHESTQWAKSVVWLGLNVINTSQENESIGTVEYEARYLEKGLIKTIHELSEFHRIEDIWFYTNGRQIAVPSKKIARNDSCPCGSQRKYKNCHAMS